MTDNSGNIYATGLDDSTSVDDRAALLKFSPSGNLLWKKVYNHGDLCEGHKAFLHPTSGHVYMYASLRDTNLNDYVGLVEYTAGGSQVNISAHTLTGEVENYNMTMDAAGNFYATGLDDGGAADSLFLMKINASGNLVWKSTLEDQFYEFNLAVAVNGSTVATAGWENQTHKGVYATYNKTSGNQAFRKKVFGNALAYSRPGAIATDAQYSWVGTSSRGVDSTHLSITKYNATGNRLWTVDQKLKSVGEAFTAIAADPNGNVYGWYYYQPVNALKDAVLIKYDANGQFMWQDSIKNKQPGAMAIDANGDVYVAMGTGNGPMSVRKYSPSGNLLWEKNYTSAASTPYTLPHIMRISPQGKVVILAQSREGADLDLSVFQYDGTGTLEWHKPMDVQSGNVNYPINILIGANGDVTAFGSSGNAYTLVRFDDNGTEIFKSNKTEFGQSMTVDATGNSYTGFVTATQYIIRKYSPIGTLLQEKLVNKTFTQTPSYLRSSGSNLIILGKAISKSGIRGQFTSVLDNNLSELFTQIDSSSNSISFIGFAESGMNKLVAVSQNYGQTFAGYWYEALVQEFSEGPIGLQESRTGPQINLYPNPAADWLQVVTNEPLKGEVQITDLSGKILLVKRISGTKTRLDLRQMSTGLYFASFYQEYAKPVYTMTFLVRK